MSPDSFSIRLKPSPRLAGLLVLGHLLAMGALATSLEGVPLALAACGVALSALATGAEALQRTPGSVYALEMRCDGRAAWRDRDERWHEAPVATGVYVSTWVVILALGRGRAARKWVVIGADSAPADELRRLRAWLRWGAGKGDPAA